MDTSSPVEELVEAKQELLEEIERLCERRDRIYGDCEVSGAVTTLRGELEGLQATRERLTGEIQAARAELLAGARAEHVPEIARLTALRAALTDRIAAAQTELQELQDSLPALRCEVIEARNELTAAREGTDARKADFEEWRAEEMAALEAQRVSVAGDRSALEADRAEVLEGREVVKTATFAIFDRERALDEKNEQLAARFMALTDREDIAVKRELGLDAQAADNNERADKIIEGRRDLEEREQARTDRSDTLDTREAALKQREADLIENWAVLEAQRRELDGGRTIRTNEIAAIQEAREAIKAAETGIAARTDQLLTDKARLESEQDALILDREHCGAIKIANDKRCSELYDGAEQQRGRDIDLVDREDALVGRSDTLDTREAAIKQREADLIENWAVLEEHRGQNAAG